MGLITSLVLELCVRKPDSNTPPNWALLKMTIVEMLN